MLMKIVSFFPPQCNPPAPLTRYVWFTNCEGCVYKAITVQWLHFKHHPQKTKRGLIVIEGIWIFECSNWFIICNASLLLKVLILFFFQCFSGRFHLPVGDVVFLIKWCFCIFKLQMLDFLHPQLICFPSKWRYCVLGYLHSL